MKNSHDHHSPVWPANRLARTSSGTLILTLVVLITVLSATPCHAGADFSEFSDERARTLPQFVGGIITRSAELIYITEQDSEVFVFYRNSPVKELTGAALLSLLRRPSGSPIQQESWSSFFQLRSNTDPTGKWMLLRQYLEANLTNTVIFRLPREDPYGAQYDLYAVGLFGGNIVVGVQMFGVAT
jgi:hypothetical protein